MPFFEPFLATVGDKPFICYTDVDVTKRFGFPVTETDARRWLAEFDGNWRLMFSRTETPFVPGDTDFMIGFLWTDLKNDYIDVWIQRRLALYGPAAPMTTLQSFNLNGGFVDAWEKGNGCNWTRIVSGREAELFLSMGGEHCDLEKYLQGPRPQMPYGFIVPWQTAAT